MDRKLRTGGIFEQQVKIGTYGTNFVKDCKLKNNSTSLQVSIHSVYIRHKICGQMPDRGDSAKQRMRLYSVVHGNICITSKVLQSKHQL